ncbi:MAG: V-type ATP synthase subunit F [Clostridia bacterium]|nr:V-type ATP synthase subunit F [Clostridia bacterium]
MRLFLISNNSDTVMGMRLAGIDGVIVNDEKSAAQALETAVKDGDIAIVLMNKSLFDMCDESIKVFRKSHTSPLLVEIPDRGSSAGGNSLAKYIRETVGINIE